MILNLKLLYFKGYKNAYHCRRTIHIMLVTPANVQYITAHISSNKRVSCIVLLLKLYNFVNYRLVFFPRLCF